jgi:hypothetical protein
MKNNKKVKKLEKYIIELEKEVEILCGEDKDAIMRVKANRIMCKSLESEIFKGNINLYLSMGILNHI